jgi:hypothetical protein
MTARMWSEFEQLSENHKRNLKISGLLRKGRREPSLLTRSCSIRTSIFNLIIKSNTSRLRISESKWLSKSSSESFPVKVVTNQYFVVASSAAVVTVHRPFPTWQSEPLFSKPVVVAVSSALVTAVHGPLASLSALNPS